MCPNGTGAVGCGPQEEFRSCADISIVDTAGTVDETPFEETTSKKDETTKEKEQTTPSDVDNEIPDETFEKAKAEATQAKTNQFLIFLVSIMGCTFILIVVLLILLYFYYYHAAEVIRNWWKKGGFGMRDATCWTAIKTKIRACSKGGKSIPEQNKNTFRPQKGPIPPPRVKKHSIGFRGVPENLV